jgi:hypothetical protein
LVLAAAAARAVNYGYVFALIDGPRKIRSRGSFIIRMRDDEKYVHFVARIGLQNLLRRLCCGDRRNKPSEKGGILSRIAENRPASRCVTMEFT